jgi:RNA polymerase sigma factor (sigma-70 family)
LDRLPLIPRRTPRTRPERPSSPASKRPARRIDPQAARELLRRGVERGWLGLAELDGLLMDQGWFESGLPRFLRQLNRHAVELRADPGSYLKDRPQAQGTEPREDEDRGPASDLLETYLAELSAFRLLSKEDEVLLARRIEATRLRFFLTVSELGATREQVAACVNLATFDGEALGTVGARAFRSAGHGASSERPLSRRATELLVHRYREYLAAREELVQRNLALVVYVAKDYRNRGVSLPDLIQEGNTGLIRAVEKFDWRLGCRFKTYASFWIQQALLRSIHNQSRTVRIPIYLRRKINRIRLLKASQSGNGRPDLSVAEISQHLGETAEAVRKAVRAGNAIVSLDEPLSGEDQFSTLEMLGGPASPIESQAMNDEGLREGLERILGVLTEREQRIVRLRFGMGEERAHTLAEVSRIFRLSKERIRQIQEHAMGKLRVLAVQAGID